MGSEHDRVGVTVALPVLAAGVVWQYFEVGQRVIQLAWFWYKFDGLHPITAGGDVFAIFSVFSILGATAAWAVSRTCHGKGWGLAARCVAALYLLGLVTWAGLVASPLVYFAR